MARPAAAPAAPQNRRSAEEWREAIEKRSEQKLSRKSAELRALVNGLVIQIEQGHTTARSALETIMLRAMAYGRLLERETEDGLRIVGAK